MVERLSVFSCVLCSFVSSVRSLNAQQGLTCLTPRRCQDLSAVDDLPNGAISVRLIRGSLSNNLPAVRSSSTLAPSP